MCSSDLATNRLEQIYRLSAMAAEGRPDVIIWPEGSLPGIGQEQFRRMTSLVREAGCWWIFGGDDVETTGASTNYYNSAFLFSPEGRFVSTYRKRRLVIFGEYVPLETWLPFMRWLTPIGGGFSSGPGPVDFVLGSNGPVASPLICFEDTFPHGTREHVGDDVDFLLEITNDGWFGRSSAQWQHAANTAFRAVENGVPLLRAANNGISCWFDAFGRLREIHETAAEGVYGPGVRQVEVSVGNGVPGPTFYRRYGDVFGWACVAVSGALLWTRRSRRRHSIP